MRINQIKQIDQHQFVYPFQSNPINPIQIYPSDPNQSIPINPIPIPTQGVALGYDQGCDQPQMGIP